MKYQWLYDIRGIYGNMGCIVIQSEWDIVIQYEWDIMGYVIYEINGSLPGAFGLGRTESNRVVGGQSLLVL